MLSYSERIKKSQKDLKHLFNYVPANFEAERYFKGKDADLANTFLSQLHWQNIRSRHKDNGYLPLYSQKLKELLGDNYKRIIEKLITLGIVETDKSYQEGSVSIGYRCAETYQTKTRRVEITYTPVKKQIRKYWREHSEKITLPVHRHLRDQLDQLTVDVDHAESIINSLDTPHPEKYSTAAYRSMLRDAVEAVNRQEHHFTFCRYGRVHTPITCFLGKLRSSLRCQGKCLVNLDISNSQPCFMSVAIKNYRQHDKNCISKPFSRDLLNPYRTSLLLQDLASLRTTCDYSQNPEIQEGGKGVGQTCHHVVETLVSSTPALLSDTDRISHKTEILAIMGGRLDLINEDRLTYLRPDERQYYLLCEGGLIYEYLADQTGLDRETTKQKYMAAIFGKTHHTNKVKETIYRDFPNVGQWMDEIKAKDYRHLSHLLQNMESTLMIWGVCNRLRIDFNTIPIYTVHDSIMTTDEHLEALRGIVEEQFAKIGFYPKLKVTHYGQ